MRKTGFITYCKQPEGPQSIVVLVAELFNYLACSFTKTTIAP
jgi:hypothetical protein